MNPLFERAQIIALTLLATVLVLFGAYRLGGRAVSRTVELRRAKRMAHGQAVRQEIKDETRILDDAAVRNAATQWVRGHSGR